MAAEHAQLSSDPTTNAMSPPTIPGDADKAQSTQIDSPQTDSVRTAATESTDSLDTPAANASSQDRSHNRESSPLRPQLKAATRGKTRSRKNSQELSPVRNAVGSASHPFPSAAAIQRALSANQPTLQPAGVDGSTDARITKSREHPRWPTSPRLTSPPPSASRTSNSHNRKQDSDMAAPNSSQKRISASDVQGQAKSGPDKEDGTGPRANLKTPARGASGVALKLETVSENSVPDTPSVIAPSEHSTTSSPRESLHLHKDDPQDSGQPKTGRTSGDSESDTGGTRSKAETQSMSGTTTAASRSSASIAKKPSAYPAGLKNKIAEPITRSMTVETETVSSVPQAPLNVPAERGASGKLDVNGSVRMKPSNEMMKPKKDKKKQVRRPASINTGTVSSKADIFEAKVATAVDEANSSDSDETFVYESNPPEPYIPRSARHHSRTPSATSVTSQIEQYAGRTKSISKEGQHNIAGKRSMKFANYNTNFDGEYGSQNPARGGLRTVTTPRHHHISRHSRGPSHVGLFDSDSPFTQANKSTTPRGSNGRSSPNSPRYFGNRASPSPRKTELYAYDADGGVADDERMPLIGSIRINRARHAKRPLGGSLRQLEYRDNDRRGYLSRNGLCLLITLLFLILCVGAGTFILALSWPLTEVSIRAIENVLASEQELVLDLDVKATNPNIFTIIVNDINIDIFAKSGFAGTSANWREHQADTHVRRKRRTRSNYRRWFNLHPIPDGIDEGNDPIDDPDLDTQTMVLGRALEFDSAVIFEPSPILRQSSVSQGEIRLTRPGNRTEEGGSARWERVIQHRFELIVRGALKYQLPLSSKMRSVSVRYRIKVDPKDSEGTRTYPRLLEA